jgi:hypothetical protein
VDHAHIGQIKVHFLSYKGSQGGVNALPHLGPGGDDGDAVCIDHDIGV